MQCHVYRHQYHESAAKYRIYADITTDRISITVEYEGIPAHTYILTLEELKSRQEWADGCCWIIASRKELVLPEYVFNMTAESMSAREDRGILTFLHNVSSVMNIYVPYVDSTFEDMVLTLMASHDAIVESNIELVEHTSRPNTVDMIPQLKMILPESMSEYIGIDRISLTDIVARIRTHHLRDIQGTFTKDGEV